MPVSCINRSIRRSGVVDTGPRLVLSLTLNGSEQGAKALNPQKCLTIVVPTPQWNCGEAERREQICKNHFQWWKKLHQVVCLNQKVAGAGHGWRSNQRTLMMDPLKLCFSDMGEQLNSQLSFEPECRCTQGPGSVPLPVGDGLDRGRLYRLRTKPETFKTDTLRALHKSQNGPVFACYSPGHKRAQTSYYSNSSPLDVSMLGWRWKRFSY